MAAGLGNRMRPVTLQTPKPLIKVNGKRMIDTIVDALRNQSINEIYVVVGYLKEQFEYLKEKYDVILVDNPDYDKANNISSLYYSRNYLKNTIILDGDQIINNINIIKQSFNNSGYVCWPIHEYRSEWILELDKNNCIKKCYRDGYSLGYELKSLSFWNKHDAMKLREYVVEEYIKNKRNDVYWDDIALFIHRDEFTLYGYPISKNDIIEIDNINELKEMGYKI